jgi:hypothetical protein
MVEVVAHAFLSYAHADDHRETGRILHLAELIANEFESLTGTKIDIFTDAEIKWGEDFRDKLNEALQETTFFIPVLTPTYFLREECRTEMTQFVASANELKLKELLLSIRYIKVADMQEGSADELKDVAARMQYEPWDGLRLEDESSSDYRKAINRLAQRLVELTEALESKPVEDALGGGASVDRANSSTDPGLENEVDDDTPGPIDDAADLQPAIESWSETVTALSPATERWTALLNQAEAKMDSANRAPNAFAAKVVIARQLAKDVEEPLVHIEELCKRYSAELLRLDPGLRAVLLMATQSTEELEDVDAFLDSIQGMVDAALESAKSLKVAADSAQDVGKMSRDLRPVFRRYATAVRNVADGSSIINSWQPLIDDLRAAKGHAAPS